MDKFRYQIHRDKIYTFNLDGRVYEVTGNTILTMVYTHLFKLHPELKAYFDE